MGVKFENQLYCKNRYGLNLILAVLCGRVKSNTRPIKLSPACLSTCVSFLKVTLDTVTFPSGGFRGGAQGPWPPLLVEYLQKIYKEND